MKKFLLFFFLIPCISFAGSMKMIGEKGNPNKVDKVIEIKVNANSSFNLPTMDIPGMPGSQMGMINLGDVLGKSFSAIQLAYSPTI